MPKLLGASALAILADFMTNHGLTSGEWLKALVTWGFPLSRDQLESLSRVFCNNIYDRYGSAELGGQVAQQCSERIGLHINPELSLIEVLDDHDEECVEGERGRLVVTNLTNLASPFVRYEQKDTALHLNECPCGRKLPIIAQIEGKDTTLIEMKDGIRVPQALLRGVVRGMDESRDLEDISFRKQSASALVVTVSPRGCFDPRNVERIREKLNKILGSMTDVSVEVASKMVKPVNN
jgi:phenylacetate-coenzyme A ligase PaaK-like adenylate-forming protein